MKYLYTLPAVLLWLGQDTNCSLGNEVLHPVLFVQRGRESSVYTLHARSAVARAFQQNTIQLRYQYNLSPSILQLHRRTLILTRIQAS